MNKVHVPAFSTHALVTEMREAGCVFTLRDGEPRVRFSPECPATAALLDELRARRAEIAAHLTEQAPERPTFDQRLAEMQARLDAEAIERAEEGRRAEARRLVQALKSAGHTITLHEGDRIQVSPAPAADLAITLREHKVALLVVLRAQAGQV